MEILRKRKAQKFYLCKVNIYLTYDYELFFGASTGTVEKCLIEPTNRLVELAEIHDVRFTFFVDIGYICRMEDFLSQSDQLQSDYILVCDQLKSLVKKGHDLQLHIHPHWEKSTFENGKWTCNTKHAYRLDDFNDDEIASIFKKYKAKLDSFRRSPSYAFRAGGWCIQPFERLKPFFEEHLLSIDSSVFPNGYFQSGNYYFDFRHAPAKSSYHFETDVVLEERTGRFTEYPIASYCYSPLFYWRLYVLGRLFPRQHKMIGDGQFMDQPGRKKAVLTGWTWNHVSTDGYYASLLTKITDHFFRKNWSDMVIIGHPKSMTNYSYKKLAEFLANRGTKYNFRSFNDLP